MTAAEIEQKVLEQLTANNTNTEPYISLAADYAAMYDVCETLKAHIADNGTVDEFGRVNPAVRELRNTNNAMIKLLKAMGIEPETIAAHNNEFDVL